MSAQRFDRRFAGIPLAHFNATLSPLADAATLHPRAYTSTEFYNHEVANIFMKEWLCVGRSDLIGKVGDYISFDIAGEPIVVTRDREGQVRAVSRVCRHRGALVVEGSGNSRGFTCPFHGWTYSLDGRLMGAPHMNRTAEFNKGVSGLRPLLVEDWEGFLFVNFDVGAEPIGPNLTALSAEFRNYRMADTRGTPHSVFENGCNWKIAMENGIDMYHTPATHPGPDSGYLIHETTREEDPAGRYTISRTPAVRPYPYATGTNQPVSSMPALPGLNSRELQSFNMFLIYPSTLIVCVPEAVLYLLAFPLDVDRTQIHLGMCYLSSTLERPDFREDLEAARAGFIATNEQDMASCQLAQRGLGSRFAAAGRYSYLEATTWDLNRYVLRMLKEFLV